MTRNKNDAVEDGQLEDTRGKEGKRERERAVVTISNARGGVGGERVRGFERRFNIDGIIYFLEIDTTPAISTEYWIFDKNRRCFYQLCSASPVHGEGFRRGYACGVGSELIRQTSSNWLVFRVEEYLYSRPPPPPPNRSRGRFQLFYNIKML